MRIILADDHALFLEGLSLMLSRNPDFQVVGSAGDGKQLLELLTVIPCDLVTLDLNMPQLNGLETLVHLKSSLPAIKVLVLSNYEQPEFKREVQRLGADGYLLKNSSITTVVEAIKRIMSGEQVFYADKIDTQEKDKDYFTDDFLRKLSLTRREVDIIRCIAREMTTREIADELFISEHTVMTHRKNLLRKVDAKNAAGLVKFASDQGLI
jgi:DNA-binding NarL/FixJ family response regulator